MWTRPRTMKTFNLTPEFAKSTKSLAANQGLYNGFLAAGLIWDFYIRMLPLDSTFRFSSWLV